MAKKPTADATTERNPEQDLFSLYLVEIEQSEKDRKSWINRAKKIIKRYRDERPTENSKKKINILWSNVQTMQPALYSRTPKPYVERKHKDNDPAARAASEILERGLTYSLSTYDFDYTIKNCRDDYLLAGLGVAWVEYHVDFLEDGITKGHESVQCKYVHWTDFGHNLARTWDEVRLVWRKIYATRNELIRQFGDEGKDIPLDYTPETLSEDKKSDEQEAFKRACIYEVWDKDNRRRVFLSKAKSGAIKIDPDPLGLSGFFPCARPLLSTTTTDDLIPVPDFCQYQDQADQLDEIAARRQILVEALRAVGIYDASLEGLQESIQRRGDTFLVPVHNWTSIVQAGGIEGAISYLPLEQIAKVLGALNVESDRIKQEIYEITGMSDIMRGASDPRETATAQQIKGQFSTLRMAERQAEIQRFARDLVAIKGEIIAEHFEPQTLAEMSGVKIEDPEKLQMFMQAVSLLKNDQLRAYRIDIETDSTIAIDDQLEKQKRTEYLEAVGQFMQNGLAFAAQLPATLPYIMEAILFASRGFKAGRSLEATLEKVLDEVQAQAEQQKQAQAQQAQQPPEPPPPDPKMVEVQMKGQIEAAELQIKQQVAEREAYIAQYDVALKELEVEKKRRELLEPFLPEASNAATVAAATPVITPPTNPLPIINLNIGKPPKAKKTRAAIVRDENGDMIGAEIEEVPDLLEQITDVPVDVDPQEVGI